MSYEKTYQTPKLERFGTLAELSAGGSLGLPETNPSIGMNPDRQRP